MNAVKTIGRWSLGVLAATLVLGLGTAQAAPTPRHGHTYAHSYQLDRSPSGGSPDAEIYTMSANGSDQTNLTTT